MLASKPLIDFSPAELSFSLAAFAIFFFEHGDGADVAPVVDFEPAVCGDLNDADDLDRGRIGIAADNQLDFHLPQALVAAKGAGPDILDQRNQFAATCLEGQNAIAGLRDDRDAGLLLHHLAEKHNLSPNRLRFKAGRLVLAWHQSCREKCDQERLSPNQHSVFNIRHSDYSAAFPTTTKSSGRSFTLPPCFILPTTC